MIPKTFSAPGTAYEPTIEDALQLGVFLMLRADVLNRRKYSYDSADEDAPTRIVMDQADVDRGGRLILPQQVVSVAFAANRFEYAIQGGTKSVNVTILHLEMPRTRYTEVGDVSVDPVTPAETVLMIYGRIEEILMRGTLYNADVTDHRARVIDPYRSPLYTEEDAPDPSLVGAYKAGSFKVLNRLSPKFSRSVSLWPIPKSFMGDFSKLDAAKDIAVAYGVTATYEVDLPNRTDMRHGV